MRRLASAYAEPSRRLLVEDGLPDEAWLPIVVRCRELGARADQPLRDTLCWTAGGIGLDEHRAAAEAVVRLALCDGSALVLLDGLDEISDEGDRQRFVGQVRRFLALYPRVRLLLTSREPGFRLAAGVLADACETWHVAELGPADIERLVLAWTRVVVGDSPENRRSAQALAARICGNDRLRRLAGNPLLLCTLLLVERNVGELPRKRSVLYNEAVKLLLRTWNVEAHDPMDPDEVVPQLAYVAFRMMVERVQRISSHALQRLLRQARWDLPEVLGYARLGVAELLRRVELRSSLLVQVGHGEEDGRLQPFYEFRHLTFQEYFAAVAAVEQYYPGCTPDDTPLDVLGPHLNGSAWREVVPLAVVLASRRQAAPLVAELVRRVLEPPSSSVMAIAKLAADSAASYPIRTGVHAREGWAHSHTLARCLRDEVRIPLALFDHALVAIATTCPETPGPGHPVRLLAGSRFRDRFRQAVLTVLQGADVALPGAAVDPAARAVPLCWTLAAIEAADPTTADAIRRGRFGVLADRLGADDRGQRLTALAACLPVSGAGVAALAPQLLERLTASDSHEQRLALLNWLALA